MKISKLLNVFEFGPIGPDGFTFRIEIYRQLGTRGKLYARVWRYETYRIQPTFPMSNGQPSHHPSDELIMMEDAEFTPAPESQSKSVSLLLEKIVGHIGDRESGSRAIERILLILKNHFNEEIDQASGHNSQPKVASKAQSSVQTGLKSNP